MEAPAFTARAADLHRAVYDIAAGYGGSFAAEHGVGIVKLAEMERCRSAVELDLMRKFKRLLDPDGLFNPGKVLPQPHAMAQLPERGAASGGSLAQRLPDPA